MIESRQKALIAANAALDKQAEDVTVIDMRALSTVTDFFIVASASTTRQIAAITEWIDHELARCGGSVLHIEGLGQPAFAKRRTTATPPGLSASGFDGLSWVLMDCGDLVVHVFNPPAREFYQLERLWADAPRLPTDDFTDLKTDYTD